MKRNSISLLVLFCLLLQINLFSQNSFIQKTSDYNLDGVFSGGGGLYYLRQLGNDLLWYGEEDAVAPGWSNVAYGVIDGNTITVVWADVPKGEILQSGNLVIQIISNDELVLTEQIGDYFGTDLWSRTSTGIEEYIDCAVKEFYLLQNYPNPFNPSTVINFKLTVQSKVQLKIFDMLGKEIAALVDDFKSPGDYKINFDASGLASGVYYYRLITPSSQITRKMVLIK